jgi:polysaccharide biosynthesis transport protein
MEDNLNINQAEHAARKQRTGIKKRFFDDPFRRSPRDYLLMFRERWYYGVIPTIIIMAVMIFLESRKDEVFETYVSLVFEPKSVTVLDNIEAVSNDLSEVEINNHLEKIFSRAFFDYFTDFSQDDTDRIKGAYINYEEPEKTPSLAQIIRPNLDVQVIRNTSIARLHVKHRDPYVAEFLANRIARKYIDFNMNQAQTSTNSVVVFLTREAEKLTDQLEAAQRNIQEYRTKYNLAKLGDDQNVIYQRATTLDGQLIAAEIDRIDLSTKFEKVKQYKEGGLNLLELPEIGDYGNIPGLETQKENLIQEADLLEQKYLENHPRVKQNVKAIESVDKLIESELRQAITDLETRLTIAIEREAQIKDQKAEADKKLLELDKISVEYELLTDQAVTARNALTTVQERLSEVTIASRIENTNIKLNDEAFVPFTPVEPNMQKAFIQSIIIGCLLVMILPLGFGLFDTRLKSSWEIEDLLESRLIGEIPKLSSVKKQDRPLVVIKDVSEVASESFRGIFSQFEIQESGNANGMILVTSTMPNEGKTLIASNVAATFANHGKKALLVDFDFRRPSLHGNFEIKNSQGSLKWLKDPNSNLDSILDDPLLGIIEYSPNFFLLRTGGVNRKPTELFNQEKLVQLLKKIKETFDIIVFDTPPVGLFPDALLLAQKTEYIFYVCRFNKVSMFKIQHFIDKLRQTNGKLTGIVLNGIPVGRASGYYHYYGYGSYSNYEYKNYYKPKKKPAGAKKPRAPKAAKTA